MAKKISEETEVKLDLKTIAILVGGVLSVFNLFHLTG